MKYAIVGFGTAGYHAVKVIREYDKTGHIDVYGNTGLAPYNPMLTTYYAFDKLDYNGMFPFGDLETIRQKVEFTYRQETVLRVHAKDRIVETQQGKECYDRILIATGARAFAPPVKGLGPEDAFLMRTVEDASRFQERLTKKNVKHAVVIGASMVGIKVVEVLHQSGIETWLLDLAKNIFPLAAYPNVAKVIEDRIERQGVHLKFGVTIDHMEQEAEAQYAVLTDGSRVPADIVGLCIGTRAATETVQGEVEINRGIVVNERMETSVPGIYAAGDCCEGRNLESGQNQIIGLWANANRQGTAAGASMAGGSARFEGNILHNITHFMNMDFIGFGDNRLTGEVIEYGNPDHGLYIRLVVDDGKILGANILDQYQISGIVKNYMLRLFAGEIFVLPDYQRAMLIKAGLTGPFIDMLEEKING
ncbi:MAG: NAD(P)/FAD-dependent oxidoreductase [Clostridiales bacterium]|nr:NAD(P)/FAD-dependent oxidoreductase [Clostridiales bacterium]